MYLSHIKTNIWHRILQSNLLKCKQSWPLGGLTVISLKIRLFGYCANLVK